MLCFRCNTGMKKSEIEGVLVDRCPNCKGIWLDVGELEMLEYGEGKERDELIREAKQEVLRDKQRLFSTCGLCPKCQKYELKQIIRVGIELDKCSACGGLFFDWGELEKVISGEEKTPFKKFLRKWLGKTTGQGK